MLHPWAVNLCSECCSPGSHQTNLLPVPHISSLRAYVLSRSFLDSSTTVLPESTAEYQRACN